MSEPEPDKDDGNGDGGWQPNAAGSSKKAYENKRFEEGGGNRKPSGPPKSKSKSEIGVGPLYKAKVDLKGAVVSTRAPGSQDKTFAQVLGGEVSDVEALAASADLNAGKAKATFIKAKAKGSVVHAEVDLVSLITNLFVDETDVPAPPEPPAPPPSPGPQAARVGDFTGHGSPLLPGIGSPNVMIGGMPAWRAQVDMHVCPFPSTAPHGMTVAVPGAATVMINGLAAARAGDMLIEPGGGPNVIAVGCPTVMIGPPAPPPPPPVPAAPAEPELPWVKFDSVAKGDVGSVEADLQVYGDVDLVKGKGKAEAQAGAVVAMLKGELPLKVKIRVPCTEYYAGLGVTLEGSLLSAGAEVGGGVKVNDGDKFFDWTGGAKIGAGLGGVGVKFGFDVTK